MYPFLKKNIEYLFEKHKTNPNRLSKEIQIPQATLFRVASGLTKEPRREVLDAISTWAGISVAVLTDANLELIEQKPEVQVEASEKKGDIYISPIEFRSTEEKKFNVRIPVYRDVKASCGSGIENFLEDPSEYLNIDPSLLRILGIQAKPENLRVIYSDEYSMWPTVAPDSPLFIDVADKDPSMLKSGSVYVFKHNYELRMKRIFISYAGGTTVRLASDNPDKSRYPDEFITNEQLNEIDFIGRLESALVKP